jgi:hypothetical protein
MAELIANLVENAKSFGILLTSASAACYASGYLAMRSRAHALGTDPDFTLLDGAYVLVGFRFAWITLLALLVVSPFLILVKASAEKLVRITQPSHLEIVARFAAIALAALTFVGASTLSVHDVLLADGSANKLPLERVLVSGILGNGRVGVIVVLITTAITAMTILWLRGRYVQTGAGDTLTMVLAVIAALQLVLLPADYGIFFAQRTVRLLERVPEGLVDVAQRVWLLDRGADRVVLLARRPDGALSLITVKTEKLDGIPIRETASIAEIIAAGVAP